MDKLQEQMQVYANAIRRLSRDRGIAGRIVSADRGARYVSLAARLTFPLQLDAALRLANPLALATGTRVVIAQREAGFILYQFELVRRFWQTYTRADLKAGPELVGMGLGDRRRQVNYEFARPHGGFFGATGSGKSIAVQTLLLGLFAAYTPGQLQAVIIDPDGDHAANFHNAVHLAGLPVARSPEEIDYALTYAHAEMLRRAGANQRQARRLVVVVDEAEKALAGGDRLRVAQAIGKDGRKWQVNLIIATQNPGEMTLPDLMPQITNRWIGAVSDARVSAYLSGHKGLECHKLTGLGDFMHVTGSQAERLLVAMPTPADFAALPRAELAPPEFVPLAAPDPERYAADEADSGRGRRPDPLDFYLVGRLLAHLAHSPALADGTLAHRVNAGIAKIARHRGAAAQVLAGLRDEIGVVAKSRNSGNNGAGRVTVED